MGNAAVNIRCMTATCAWVGRSRPLRLDAIGLGAGAFGLLRIVCECGSEPEVEVVNLGVAPPVVARIPTSQP